MERGLILKKGTVVDSTIISAPSSTKNKEKMWDPDAHQAVSYTHLQVGEPDEKKTLAILRALRPKYEAHHGLAIEDGALSSAVTLSKRYLPCLLYTSRLLRRAQSAAQQGGGQPRGVFALYAGGGGRAALR